SVQLSTGEEVRGDVLIGADGSRSAVRSALLASLGEPPCEPTFQDILSWWSRVPLTAVEGFSELDETNLPRGTAKSYKGPGLVFVLARSVVDADIYWSGFQLVHEKPESRPDDYRHQCLEVFASCHPAVLQAIEASAPGRVAGALISDLDPPPNSWSDGRVVLIGDAAHAMTPFIGQGANSAMLDAYILCKQLAFRADDGDWEGAFAKYAASRQAVATKKIEEARKMARVFMTDSKLHTWGFNAFMRLVPKFVIEKQFTDMDEGNSLELDLS
ncbi:MAG: FAD-dependent monooxygenase, partial [Myxococcales bacterium]|nr:FAD-dependent monooxygenase [Myxococcales bacterium]